MNKLFKFYHKDGREWTNCEIASYYTDRPRRWTKNVTLLIDDDGFPTAEVFIGDELMDFGNDIQVIWNKEMLERLPTEICTIGD